MTTAAARPGGGGLLPGQAGVGTRGTALSLFPIHFFLFFVGRGLPDVPTRTAPPRTGELPPKATEGVTWGGTAPLFDLVILRPFSLSF